MRAAYLFHLVNLLVSVAMVPVLLGGLSVADYAIWLAFLTIGNATIQIQNAVQSVVVKDISRAYHGTSVPHFRNARRRTRRAYLGLVALVLGPVMAGGFVYLDAIGASSDVAPTGVAWVIFILAFASVYLCGPYNALLIGTGHVGRQNNINTLTRLIQLAGVMAALAAGYGILGLSVAFAVATMSGSALSALAARGVGGPIGEAAAERSGRAPPRSSILGYICFAAAAYGLYNGMYLVVAAHVSRDTAASYGLSIQIATLLLAVATAPFNVWLARLTRAVARGDGEAAAAEVARTFLVVNLVFATGFAGLMVLGAPLLELIGADMRLPSHRHLALVGVAFMIEANILVLVNYLMVRGDFGFVRPYVAGAVVGTALGVLTARWTGYVYAFIALPALVQGCVALPLLSRRVRSTLGGSWVLLARSAVAFVGAKLAQHGPLRR